MVFWDLIPCLRVSLGPRFPFWGLEVGFTWLVLCELGCYTCGGGTGRQILVSSPAAQFKIQRALVCKSPQLAQEFVPRMAATAAAEQAAKAPCTALLEHIGLAAALSWVCQVVLV